MLDFISQIQKKTESPINRKQVVIPNEMPSFELKLEFTVLNKRQLELGYL
jgi:hypothetical protein